MSKKPTIPTLTGALSSQINQINNSLQDLANAFDNTISRDGSAPNAMEANFDLNSNDILNGKDAYLQNLYLGGSRVVPTDLADFTYTQSVANAVERNLSDFLAERITVTDFGADPSASAAVNGAAFQAASDWWRLTKLRRGVIVVPQGEYVVDRPLFTDDTLDANLAGFSTGQGLGLVGEFGPGNVIIKPQYTPRGLRTAGLWSGKYAEIPFIEWVQPTKTAFFYLRNITIQGQENLNTDPVGFKGVNVNLSAWNDCVFENLKNTAWSCESLNNSASYNMQIKNCGYQPTNYKDGGFLASGVQFSIASGDNTLTATASVFDSGDVGKWVVLEPNSGSGNNPFISKIDTYTSATEVELVDAAPGDYTSVRGSFSIVTGSISAGDKTLTLDADVALSSLRGALIHVYGAGYEDTSGSGGFNDTEARLLSTRIDSITSLSEVELAHGARVTVSNVPVIFMPSMHIGWSSDTQQYSGNNNDVEFYRLRDESSFANNRGYVAMVTQRAYGIWFIGCKFHGTGPGYDNFGANGMLHVNDNPKHLIFNSCQHEWGYWEPDYGQRVYLGDRIGIRDVYSHFGHPNYVPTKVNWISVEAVDLNDTFVDLNGFNNTTNWATTSDRKYFNFKNSETTQGQVAMSASVFERQTGNHYYLIPRDAYSADGVEPIGNATSGTFTPTLELGGTEISTASGAYTTQTGSWTRHGRLIHISVKLKLSAKGSATGSAAVRIPSDIRETTDTARNNAVVGPVYITNCTSIDRGVIARFGSNQLINLWELVGTGGGASVNVNDTNLTDTSEIQFSGTYEVISSEYNYYP